MSGMKKAKGYAIVHDPAMAVPIETDTFTCCHCQKVVDKPAFKGPTDDEIGAWCYNCNAPRCLEPACLARGCVPIERWLHEQETKVHYEALLAEGRK